MSDVSSLQVFSNPNPEMIPTDSDAGLWVRFKDGDKEAFSNIYQKYVQVLYNYGLKLTDDPDLVEDAIQDLFITLWQSKENLSYTDSIKFYLFKSLRRKIVNTTEEQLRAQNKNAEFDILEPAISFSHEHVLVTEQEQVEQKEILAQAMLALTKRQREAIYLKFYDNLSFQEVANVMSLSTKATYNLIGKAITTLRQHSQLVNICALLFCSNHL